MKQNFELFFSKCIIEQENIQVSIILSAYILFIFILNLNHKNLKLF